MIGHLQVFPQFFPRRQLVRKASDEAQILRLLSNKLTPIGTLAKNLLDRCEVRAQLLFDRKPESRVWYRYLNANNTRVTYRFELFQNLIGVFVRVQVFAGCSSMVNLLQLLHVLLVQVVKLFQNVGRLCVDVFNRFLNNVQERFPKVLLLSVQRLLVRGQRSVVDSNDLQEAISFNGIKGDS